MEREASLVTHLLGALSLTSPTFSSFSSSIFVGANEEEKGPSSGTVSPQNVVPSVIRPTKLRIPKTFTALVFRTID